MFINGFRFTTKLSVLAPAGIILLLAGPIVISAEEQEAAKVDPSTVDPSSKGQLAAPATGRNLFELPPESESATKIKSLVTSEEEPLYRKRKALDDESDYFTVADYNRKMRHFCQGRTSEPECVEFGGDRGRRNKQNSAVLCKDDPLNERCFEKRKAEIDKQLLADGKCSANPNKKSCKNYRKKMGIIESITEGGKKKKKKRK